MPHITNLINHLRGCSSMVEQQLPKLRFIHSFQRKVQLSKPVSAYGFLRVTAMQLKMAGAIALVLLAPIPAIAQEEPHALIVALYDYDAGRLLHYRKWKHGLTAEQCERTRGGMVYLWTEGRTVKERRDGVLQDFQLEQYFRIGCWPEAGIGGDEFKAWVEERVGVR
jgi:hypothetical protein